MKRHYTGDTIPTSESFATIESIEDTHGHLKKGDGRADHTRNKGKHSCEILEVLWSILLKSVPVSVKEL